MSQFPNPANDTDGPELEEDFLSVDTPIPGQNFACLSFVSPEKELARKEVFRLHRFLEEHAEDFGLSREKLTDKYDDYVYHHEEELEKAFTEENDFRTTVRGVKVRGTYDTYREAQVRAKLLQRKDPSFHVFVGQVGYWLPWDPDADKVDDQEYTEGHLNKLVKKYKENQKKRDVFFEDQKRESLNKIKKDNATQGTEGNSAEGNSAEGNSAEGNSAETDDSTTEPPNPPSIAEALQGEDPWLQRQKLNDEGNPVLDLDA